jgi:putative transposase
MKHLDIAGHIYYVTTVVYRRLRLFTNPAYVIPLFDSLHYYRHRHQCRLLGYVIMPDHIHFMLWPQQEDALENFMRDFKSYTAKRLIRQAEVEERRDLVAAFEQAGAETGRSEHKVWQDSYWDKNIYTERFLRQKLNYIHRNPLLAGLVEDVAAYPYSSYRNYVIGDDSLIEIDRGWM